MRSPEDAEELSLNWLSFAPKPEELELPPVPLEPPVDPPIDPPIDPPTEPPVDPPIDPPVDPPVEPPVGPLNDSRVLVVSSLGPKLVSVLCCSKAPESW